MHQPLLSPGRSAFDARYAKLTLAAGIFFAALEVSYFGLAGLRLAHPIPFDPFGPAVGRDFVNTWIGARSAFSGGPAPWFDFATYNGMLRALTGNPNFPDLFWSYPPHLVLLIWPLGLLPYLPAYAVWCVGGLALYLLAARGVGHRHLLFLALAPAVAVNVFFGQNGFLTAALLIGGLTSLDRRPILAGVLFGLLTIKPQFGFLLPVLLVLTGRWRVIAAAVATAVVLVAATALWFGPDIWLEYIRKVTPQQHWLLTQGGGLLVPMVSSAFVNARMMGLPLGVDWIVQAVVSTAALAAVVWTFWRRRDPVLAQALFVTATFLFSPWMLTYDMVVLVWVVALLRGRSDGTAIDHYLEIAVWTLPVTMLLLGAAHVALATPLLLAFAGRLVWRLAHVEQRFAEGRAAAAVSSAGPGDALSAAAGAKGQSCLAGPSGTPI